MHEDEAPTLTVSLIGAIGFNALIFSLAMLL
jgi:hypothetical protein